MMREPYEFICPLSSRYTPSDEEFFDRCGEYLSQKAIIKYQMKVELALVKALSSVGICPKSVPEEVEKAIEEVTAEEAYEEEKKIQHNLRAIVNCIRRRISDEAKPYIHLFATSFDIVDSAMALFMKDFAKDVIIPDLKKLGKLLIKIARKNAEVRQIGRTHGQHAEPITFGFAMALYVSRIGNRIKTIEKTSENLVGKFSGAVGAYNTISLFEQENPEKIERLILKELGLKPAQISTQIVQPEYMTDFLSSIVSTFSVLANLADDMRHLTRNEIGEIKQKVGKTNVGSSTMPHKVNPKDFENVKSLWKTFMPRMTTSFLDQISEHQRDLTNSASSRFNSELLAGFAYAIYRMHKALKKIEIDEKQMMKNLEMSKEFILAEPLYILLGLKGFPNPYDYVKNLVNTAREKGESVTNIMKSDKKIQKYLDEFEDWQTNIIDDPTSYIGASAKKTKEVCDYWEKEF